MKTLATASLLQNVHQRELCEDFTKGYDTTSIWKEVITPTSPIVGSVLSQVGTGDNINITLTTIDAPFVLTVNKPIDFTARVSITDAAGDSDVAFFVGLAEEVVTLFDDLLIDDVGTLAASAYNLFGVYHRSLTSNLRVVTGLNGTYTDNLTNVPMPLVAGSFITIGVHINPISAIKTEVAFTIDALGGANPQQAISGDTTLIPTTIKHVVDITAELATAIKPVIYAKQTSASVATMKTDYIAACQHR